TSSSEPARYQRTLAPTPSLLPPPPRTRTFIQRRPPVSVVLRHRPALSRNWVLTMSRRPSLSKSATSARGFPGCHAPPTLPADGPKPVAPDGLKVMSALLRKIRTE